jgi:hypothetical protein
MVVQDGCHILDILFVYSLHFVFYGGGFCEHSESAKGELYVASMESVDAAYIARQCIQR